MQCCNLPWEQEIDGSNPFARADSERKKIDGLFRTGAGRAYFIGFLVRI